jgi:hypothetical protein
LRRRYDSTEGKPEGIGCGDVEWIKVARDKGRWRTYVSTIIVIIARKRGEILDQLSDSHLFKECAV